ncbi:MAG TPA: YkvA family protein [Candidatus Obscuribacterales bacterium]
MKNLAQSFYAWYRSTLRNAKYRWIIVIATIVYLISPIDLAPDFIPVIGWLDDGIIVTLLVTELSQMAMEVLKARTASKAKNRQEPATPEPVVVEVMDS